MVFMSHLPPPCVDKAMEIGEKAPEQRASPPSTLGPLMSRWRWLMMSCVLPTGSCASVVVLFASHLAMPAALEDTLHPSTGARCAMSFLLCLPSAVGWVCTVSSVQSTMEDFDMVSSEKCLMLPRPIFCIEACLSIQIDSLPEFWKAVATGQKARGALCPKSSISKFLAKCFSF